MKCSYLPGLLLVIAIAVTNMALAQSRVINTKVTSRSVSMPMESFLPDRAKEVFSKRPPGVAGARTMMNPGSRPVNMKQRLARYSTPEYAYMYHYLQEKKRNPRISSLKGMEIARNNRSSLESVMTRYRSRPIDVSIMPSRLPEREFRAHFAPYINKLKKRP